MESRVAVISIIIDDTGSIDRLNTLLHEYGRYIIGRMGIPYREKDMNIICVVMDGPQDAINSLAGALGRIPEITAKATYAKK